MCSTSRAATTINMPNEMINSYVSFKNLEPNDETNSNSNNQIERKEILIENNNKLIPEIIPYKPTNANGHVRLIDKNIDRKINFRKRRPDNNNELLDQSNHQLHQQRKSKRSKLMIQNFKSNEQCENLLSKIKNIIPADPDFCSKTINLNDDMVNFKLEKYFQSAAAAAANENNRAASEHTTAADNLKNNKAKQAMLNEIVTELMDSLADPSLSNNYINNVKIQLRNKYEQNVQLNNENNIKESEPEPEKQNLINSLNLNENTCDEPFRNLFAEATKFNEVNQQEFIDMNNNKSNFSFTCQTFDDNYLHKNSAFHIFCNTDNK